MLVLRVSHRQSGARHYPLSEIWDGSEGGWRDQDPARRCGQLLEYPQNQPQMVTPPLLCRLPASLLLLHMSHSFVFPTFFLSLPFLLAFVFLSFWCHLCCLSRRKLNAICSVCIALCLRTPQWKVPQDLNSRFGDPVPGETKRLKVVYHGDSSEVPIVSRFLFAFLLFFFSLPF